MVFLCFSKYWFKQNIKIISIGYYPIFGTKEKDITSEVSDNKLSSEQTIDSKGQITLIISATFDNISIYDDYAIHEINVADLTYLSTYNNKIQIKESYPRN